MDKRGHGEIQIDILRILDDHPLTSAMIAIQVTHQPHEVRRALGLLTARSFVERSTDGEYSATKVGKAFLASGNAFVGGPVQLMVKVKIVSNSFRQRAWTAMRLQRRFTLPDVLTVAANDADKDPESNLQFYARQLVRFGYLSVNKKARAGRATTSNGFHVYCLIRDTGAVAPVVRRGNKFCHDENLSRTFEPVATTSQDTLEDVA